jgi:hypothetical protein
MKSQTIAFCIGLAAALGLAAPQAWAEGGKRVAFLDGPIADKYIGGMTRSFTETAKANGLEVSVVQSPFDPALSSGLAGSRRRPWPSCASASWKSAISCKPKHAPPGHSIAIGD